MIDKKTRIIFSGNAKNEFHKLNEIVGNNIKKSLIPKDFNVPNLWRIELFNY